MFNKTNNIHITYSGMFLQPLLLWKSKDY